MHLFRSTTFSLLIVFSSVFNGLSAQETPSLLPLPTTVAWGSQFSPLPQTLRVYANNPQLFAKAIDALKAGGYGKLELVQNPDKAFVHFSTGSGGGYPEGYSLSIGTSGAKIIADKEAGAFYAAQTLLQLLDQAYRSGEERIQHVEISDRPRFAWRGLHLDVSRHFRSVEFIKKYLDAMARFKLNTFHWHLTDDQGWRIEIKKYPKLTQAGATRNGTLVGHAGDEPQKFDGKKHGGFYTQAQIRDIVAYAQARCITVVPEIELPGHASAALFAYPEFSCENHRPTEVPKSWGVFNGVFKASDETFRFIEDVLDEVCTLFPGTYIHIGGDEVPTEPWKKCPATQAYLQANGIPGDAVQRFFISRVAKYLLGKGKKPIGWDEILEEGLTPDAAVMSWRGEKGGIEAAKAGHNVVMTPGFALYFDHYQGAQENEPLAIGGSTPLSEVYAYDPAPASLEPGIGLRIMGAQANLWSEYMPTDEQVEYMAYPRALALAEITWSPNNNRNYEEFMKRIGAHLLTLDALGIRYRVPEPLGVENMTYVAMGGYRKLRCMPPLPDAKVLIRLKGGREPAKPANNPLIFELEFGQSVTYQAFTQTENGRVSPPVTFTVGYENPLKSIEYNGKPEPGAKVSLYDGSFKSVREVSYAQPIGSGTMTQIIFPGKTQPDGNPYADFVGRLTEIAQKPKDFSQIGLHVKGLLYVQVAGVYTLHLGSDDGASIRVGDNWILDNDGLHGYQVRKGEIALDPGVHPFQLFYFNAGGDGQLDLRWTAPDGTTTAVEVFKAKE